MKKLFVTLLCALTVSVGMAQNTVTQPKPDDSFMPHGGTHGWDSNEGTNNYYQNTENTNPKTSETAPDYSKKQAEKPAVVASYTKGYIAKKIKQGDKFLKAGKYADALTAYTKAKKATLAKDAKADVSSIEDSIAACREKLGTRPSCCQ